MSDLRSGTRRWLVPVLFLALGTGLLTVGYRSWQRSTHRRAVLDRARNQSRSEAIPPLQVLLTDDPDDVEVLKAIVDLQLRSGELNTLVEPHLDRLCQLVPSDPEPFRIRARMRTQFSRYEEALDDLRHVVELLPADQDARFERAQLAVILGRTEEAEDQLAFLKGSTNWPAEQLATLQARLAWQTGDPARADRILNEGLASNPGYAPAQVLRGMVAYDLGRYPEAVSLLRPQIEGPPEVRPTALDYLAKSLYALQQNAEADRVYEQLRKETDANRYLADARQRPEDAELQLKAAQALRAARRSSEARGFLETVFLRLKPDATGLRLLADCYQDEGQGEAARQLRERAAQLSPSK